MGSLQQPTPEQYAHLEKAGRLATLGASERVGVEGSKTAVKFSLPRQAVCLMELTW